MTMFYEMFARGQWVDRREDNLIDGGAPFYGAFECADGKHVTIGPIEAKFYAEFLECVGLIDPAFARRDDKRCWPTLMEKIRAAFKHRTRDEWCAILEGTDVCFGPVFDSGRGTQAPPPRRAINLP